MTPQSIRRDWRGQWLSVHDLAALMGKSYSVVYAFLQQPTQGFSTLRCGGRIWVRVDPRVYDSLLGPTA